ncbi:hypothetical protein LguiB_004651 [Lonicera macranthoides]
MTLVLSLLFLATHMTEATIPCGTVTMKAAPCLNFATGKDAKPAPACCTGLTQLAGSVKSVSDKKDICRCLKNGVKSIGGVQDKFLTQIPTACKIKVGFPVSISVNCETIH